ncbi:TPA: hypothetical protein RG682_000767 [Vibrio alginolyticus]|nr:hypothetical protein [Vibrio alginolyticus]
MSFIKNLQKNINKVTEGYFANWTPDMPIDVGDYGDISGYRFTRDGNINRFIKDVEIEKIRLETATLEKKDGIIVNAGGTAEGDVNIGQAKLDLQFGSEGSFLYHLKDLTNIQFKERREAFEKLGALILSEKLKWKDDYVLVTEVKQAGKAVILVADSANANMEIECSASEGSSANLANSVGGINYSRDSDRVVRYEIEQNTSLLFRVIGFTEAPPGGGPNGPLSQMMAKVRSWYGDELPKPERIYLRDYVETDGVTEGTFILPNSESITLSQKVEDIDSFILKSEQENTLDEGITIEKVQINQRQMYG